MRWLRRLRDKEEYIALVNFQITDTLFTLMELYATGTPSSHVEVEIKDLVNSQQHLHDLRFCRKQILDHIVSELQIH